MCAEGAHPLLRHLCLYKELVSSKRREIFKGQVKVLFRTYLSIKTGPPYLWPSGVTLVLLPSGPLNFRSVLVPGIGQDTDTYIFYQQGAAVDVIPIFL